MQWGSYWSVTAHAGMNPFWLSELEQVRHGGKSRRKSVNPLVRMTPPKSKTPMAARDGFSSSILTPSESLTNGIPKRELLYATEAFDRQREDTVVDADSRWRASGYPQVRVPRLDTMLLVAFQKLLYIEEREFLVLLIASECE